MIIKLTNDKSWRVKHHLAKNFSLISRAVGKDVSDSLIPVFAKLLRDSEKEVRLQAVRSLAGFVSLLKVEKLGSILGNLETLASDHVPLIRAAAAEVLGSMIQIKSLKNMLGAKENMGKRVHTIIKSLVLDENIEVQLEAYKVVRQYGVYGNHDMPEIQNSLKTVLESHSSWRLRAAALDTLMHLAVLSKDQKNFEKNYKKTFSAGLRDEAERVRALACGYIPKLATFMEDGYVVTTFGVDLLTIISDSSKFSYQVRISALYGFGHLYGSLGKKDQADQLILAQILPLHKDPLANVRMVALKVLRDIFDVIKKPDVKEEIKKVVMEVRANEKDPETLHIANSFPL